ncbi:RHS repeat-associated core domain-containing protein [Aquirhabdus parva]|uniref:RHS repeat-associated core domain-containing protein n=1 Tax=Aquirhabdus parva TaxID=2283318 RepID=A0A345P5P1_9GAMM|nr:RHS repeat-associated core domain-containing protein [Aquirhabdus parva]AXI02600.1 hypothetical protein HYN46_07025 [Aquirhabdus parva]
MMILNSADKQVGKNKSESIRKLSMFVTILMGILFIILHSSAYAAMAESQYKAAQMPNTQSCTVGRDLLSEETEYDKTDITGPLTYSRHYETTLSYNQNRTDDMTNGLKSIGGWTDNYNNYVLVAPAGDGVQAIMRLRLPGDKDDTYYIVNLNTRSVQRIYSPTPLIFEAAYIARGDGNAGGADNIGSISTDHRDRKLIMYSGSTTITNLSFSVNNLGTVYDFQYKKSTADDGTAVYKMVRVTYPDGRRLGLSYETWGGVGLLSVADNRGHLLTFTRGQFMDGWAIRSYVQKVSLTASNGSTFPDQQTATYQYQASDWANFRVKNEENQRFYTISSATSSLYGTETYTYTPAALSTAQFNGVNYFGSQYQVQVLNNVKNTAGLTQLHWDYGNGPGAQWTMLTNSYQPLSPKNVQSVGRTAWGNGVISGASFTSYATFTTDFNSAGSSQTTSGQIASFADSNSPYTTFKFTGFPCVTYNKVPVSQEDIDIHFNNVKDIYDYNGNHTHFTYDGMNRVATVEEAVGTAKARTTTYDYGLLSDGSTNTYNIPTTIKYNITNNIPLMTVTNTVAPTGRVTRTVKSYTQSGSATQTFDYTYYEDPTQSNYGLLKTFDGPRSDVDDTVSYTYDQFGNIASKTSKVGHTWASGDTSYTTSYYNYNSAGQPQVITTPDGLSDQLIYDGHYNLTTKIHGQWNGTSVTGLVTTNNYNDLNQLYQSTDEDGIITKFEYDALGRLTKTTYANGNSEIRTYFPNNVLNGLVHFNASGALTESTWYGIDGNGRVSYTKQGSGNNLRWVITYYDPNGNLNRTQTAYGINNYWTYDALNRVATHTDGNGKVDTKDFDSADNEFSTKAANYAGSNRTFVNQNILSTESNNDYGSSSYSYNLANDLTTSVHDVRRCDYNNIDQLGRKQGNTCYFNGGNTDQQLLVADNYTYDNTGYGRLDNVFSRTGNGSVTGYGFDTYGRIISKAQHNNTPVTWGYSSSALSNGYSYSNAGRRTHITLPSGNQIDYSYANGLISSVKVNNQYIANAIAYDGSNQLQGWQWGNGATIYWIERNDANEIKRVRSSNVSGGQLFDTIPSYDADGRISTIDLANVGTYIYYYDNNAQITGESGPGYGVNYSYDDNGNRKTLTGTGNTGLKSNNVTYGYTGNKMASWSKDGQSQSIWWLPTGEMLDYTNGASTYDYQGRRRKEASNPSMPQYTGMYMDYNFKNERTFRGGSYIDRQYVYDESSHLIGEYGLTGNMIVEYVWLGEKPIAALYPNNRIIYLITDQQDKPRRGVDASNQQVVWSWDPDAFGNRQPTGSIQMNLRFPGQYYDEQTGLYYNQNRYYNPELGRYMEPDPLGLKAGLNPYAYTGNNPVNQVDPTGLCIEDLCVGEIIAARYAIMIATPYVVQGANYIYMNAPRIAAAAEGLLPSSAGAVSSALGGITAKVEGVVASKGWKVGDDVYKATAKGNEPAWSTVRSRFWKNENATANSAEKYGAENSERMSKGSAPQRYNDMKGDMESMELSHEPIPKRDGGKDFIPRWPQDHAAVDTYRRPGY